MSVEVEVVRGRSRCKFGFGLVGLKFSYFP
jgi:hypothetical protein